MGKIDFRVSVIMTIHFFLDYNFVIVTDPLTTFAYGIPWNPATALTRVPVQ
jgi:hypothetical protein